MGMFTTRDDGSPCVVQEKDALECAVKRDVRHKPVNDRFRCKLLYNDKSPLENMHCARLFEINSIPRIA